MTTTIFPHVATEHPQAAAEPPQAEAEDPPTEDQPILSPPRLVTRHRLGTQLLRATYPPATDHHPEAPRLQDPRREERPRRDPQVVPHRLRRQDPLAETRLRQAKRHPRWRRAPRAPVQTHGRTLTRAR